MRGCADVSVPAGIWASCEHGGGSGLSCAPLAMKNCAIRVQWRPTFRRAPTKHRRKKRKNYKRQVAAVGALDTHPSCCA